MKKAERLTHVETWAKSGLSRPAYCRKHGLKYGTFMSWFKLKAQEPGAGKFIALPREISSSEIVIKFPNGICVHYRGPLSEEVIKILQHA
jgi:hypothetical protein